MSQKTQLPPANNIYECLTKAPNSPVPSLKAIVVKVQEPKAFTGKDGKPGTRVALRIRDPTGEISFTMFNPPKVPEVNDILDITSGYIKPPYQPGGANELGLSQWNSSVVTMGKGQAPQAVQAPQPQGQDPAAQFFGLQQKPNPQPAAAPVTQWVQPVHPVTQQSPAMPNWATGSQGFLPPVQAPVQAPTPQPAPVQQAPTAPIPSEEYPDGDSLYKPDVASAILALSENLVMLSCKIEEGIKETNQNLSAIYQELMTGGVDLDSKFDEIYKRLVKNGIKPEIIFAALAKACAETNGLVDHKTAIGVFATEKGIDINDIIGEK